MENKLKIYIVDYASGLFRKQNRSSQVIYSDKELKIGDFIIVEHVDCGIFVAQVVDDDSENFYYLYEGGNEDVIKDIDYKYVQHVDLTAYLNKLEKEKRKEELKEKMKEEFKKIDEKKKYEYYASMDDDFKKLYEEFKQLDD